ncbi:MAG: hypothetical protein ACRCY8_15645, partial [Dermatophilaceae bacterium]
MTATSPPRTDPSPGAATSPSAATSSGTGASSGTGMSAPLDAARTPVGPGAVTVLGALLAIGVIALGVVALQTAVSA